MADTVTIMETAGADYTWATAGFTWASASGGKTWDTAYPAIYDLVVAVALAVSEVRASNATKAVSEQLGFAEALTRQVTMRRAETIAFAETYADLIAYVLRFVESVGFSDSVSRSSQKVVSESLQVSELLSKAGIKRISESIAFAETYTDLIAFVLAISENLGFSDVLGNHTTKPVAEAFGMADALSKQAVKNVAESLAFAEAFGRTVAYRRAINEGLAFSDAWRRAYALDVSEALHFAEQYRRKANGVVSDMIVASTTITEQDFMDIMDAGHPPGYTNFRDFIPGDYTYERALFRAILESQNADRGYIDGLRVTIDVPDVFDRGSEQITNAATGVTVNFTRTFRIAPEVTITHKGGTVVAVPKLIGAVTTTGFTAVLEDSTGTRVTGSFTWVAQGY